jgi:hypothetical protein
VSSKDFIDDAGITTSPQQFNCPGHLSARRMRFQEANASMIQGTQGWYPPRPLELICRTPYFFADRDETISGRRQRRIFTWFARMSAATAVG